MNHLDEMTYLLYLDGQLDAERARELNAHVASCSECQALLHALEGEGRWLRAALVEEDEAVPAHLIAPPSRARGPWAWITGFGFASAGVYTLWSGIVEPWRDQLNQAGFNGGNLLTILIFRGALWKGWGTMISLIEFFVTMTVGIIVLALLRRRGGRSSTIALVMGSLALALAPPASAQQVIRGKQSYTLPAGETMKHDLIVFADMIHIEGEVDGDLIAFAQSVTVNGHVTGDVVAFCNHTQINGRVDGNVRTFNQSLNLIGTVGKNVTTWSQTFELVPKSQVGGSLYAFDQAGSIGGQVARDFASFAESTQVSGLVGGDTTITGHNLTIASSGELRGHTKFRGHHPPEISPGAKLASPIDFELLKEGPKYATFHFYWFQALGWAAAFLFGLILVLVAPGLFSDILRASNRYGAAMGFGVLFLIATPIAAILACITLILLPVGLSAVFLYLMALYATQVFVGTWLGEKILGAGVGTGATLGRMALGLLVIRIVKNLPYIGGWALSFVIVWGLGALTMAIYKNIRPQPAVA